MSKRKTRAKIGPEARAAKEAKIKRQVAALKKAWESASEEERAAFMERAGIKLILRNGGGRQR